VEQALNHHFSRQAIIEFQSEGIRLWAFWQETFHNYVRTANEISSWQLHNMCVLFHNTGIHIFSSMFNIT